MQKPLIIFPKDKEARDVEGFLIKVETGTIRSLQVDGDLGTDEIVVAYSGIDPSDSTDAYDGDRLPLVLSKTSPAIPIYGTVVVNITKPITTNDVGLRLI